MDRRLPADSPTPKTTLSAAALESVADTLAAAQMAEDVAPGMTMAVARNGKIVFARGWGKGDLSRNAPAGPDTVYKIGSVTKQYTAALILRLAQAGKLDLQDSITRFLPDYPTQGHTVTVRQLLDHTSGIKSFSLLEDSGAFFRRGRSYREIVDRFGKAPFDFPPGAKFQYNNTGYYLLGEIITRVTGRPYADVVERDLLQPLGLRRTGHLDDSRSVPGLARGYERREGKRVDAATVSVRTLGAAGALCAAAADLLQWTHLLHGGKVVSAASLREMTTPAVLRTGERTEYGCGLFLGDLDGHRKIFHGGRGLGFLSLVTHYPQDGLTTVVLLNDGTDRQRRDDIERLLARAALGLQARDLPLTPAEIARCAGMYAVTVGQRTLNLRVFEEGGQLKARVEAGNPLRLRHQGGYRFIGGDRDEIVLAFAPENARAERVTVNLRGQEYSGTRKP